MIEDYVRMVFARFCVLTLAGCVAFLYLHEQEESVEHPSVLRTGIAVLLSAACIAEMLMAFPLAERQP